SIVPVIRNAPDVNGSDVIARHDESTIGRKGGGEYRTLVTPVGIDFLPVAGVPKLDGLVEAAGHEQFAVGAEFGAANIELLFVWLLAAQRDRKSTRLNSSHVSISYAVFCLKK